MIYRKFNLQFFVLFHEIKDIHLFIDKTKVMFPKLNYLSMLGNVACPNQLVDPSKDEYDYSRYRFFNFYTIYLTYFSNLISILKRKYVLHRLRTLKVGFIFFLFKTTSFEVYSLKIFIQFSF